MQSFVDHQEDFDQILDLINSLKPTTWTGLAGILRCLLWAGIKLYIEENWDAAVEARDFFGPGWNFILDLNFAGGEAPNIEEWWKNVVQLKKYQEFKNTFARSKEAYLQQVGNQHNGNPNV